MNSKLKRKYQIKKFKEYQTRITELLTENVKLKYIINQARIPRSDKF